jgi:predicted dehydrogenase
MKVVAVVEPNAERRNALGDEHQVPAANRMASYTELASRPKLAEAAINATVDAVHYESSLPLIEAGYHLLLEKPIALCEQHVRKLIDAARKHQRVVMIGLNMRYNGFHAKARELLHGGAIGKLTGMHLAEYVSHYHLTTTFIRNPRYAGVTPTPMLVQKCCHDLDIIAFLAEERARRVASFATPSRFIPANAPAGSTTRCLNGCKVEATCPFSARKFYIEEHHWEEYPWPTSHFGANPSIEIKEQSLKTDNPYGRCVWQVPDHTAVDHQNVLIEFASGMTATFDMFCAAPREARTLHLMGTTGEMFGDADQGILHVRRMSRANGAFYTEEIFRIDRTSGEHYGSDKRLLEDFVAVVRNDPAGKGLSRIENSLHGHQIVFAAVEAMKSGKIVEVRQ